MDLQLDKYRIDKAEEIITPALVIYPEIVDANILATLRLAGNDPNRWRPHIKTVKAAEILKQLMSHDVVNFKCATTLELLTACQSGAADVLLAFPVVGANARRTLAIARDHSKTRVSVLIESGVQLEPWRDNQVGIFIDVNPGMNRTGIAPERAPEIVEMARSAGKQFRGLHYYDGHVSSFAASERENRAHAGYDRLMMVADALISAGIAIQEIITSGTPAAPSAMSYAKFRDQSFTHRISPGTLVFNDMTSLGQFPVHGFAPAALVLSTVVSHPAAGHITCDAGHKSVSADSGVPTCSVIGHPELTPLKPSEEHLPMQVEFEGRMPAIGEQLYLLPRHVCPSVNNFDEAMLVVGGRVRSVIPITARGHENPLLRATPLV
ncbi:MAG: alanine racemase [Acidobacteriota bacterium]|nr:alanine racemase [Acidobacteriota bacterium]